MLGSFKKIGELKDRVVAMFSDAFSCDVLNSLGVDANTRKNFKLRPEENTPSCSIRKDGYIKDFGGDFSGDIISFVQTHTNMSFPDSVKYLANYAGIENNNYGYDIKYDKNSLPTVTLPKKVQKKEKPEKPKYDLNKIKANNKRDATPLKLLNGVQELYPNVTHISKDTEKFLGFSSYHNSLTIEFEGVSAVRMSKKNIKWQTFGSKNIILHKNNKNDDVVYFAVGMAEIIAFEEMGVSYICPQSDSIRFEDKKLLTDKTIVVLQENDESSIKVTQRVIDYFPFVKVIDLAKDDKTKPKGYDFRDFINEVGGFEVAKLNLELITKHLEYQKSKNPANKEIVIDYSDKYIPPINREEGVIIARTGAGKTYGFLDKPDTLILVPRVYQATVHEGDTSQYLLNVIANNGAVITYHKFYGHYTNNAEFRSAIDNKKIQVVVDEAHEIISSPTKVKQLIYKLPALFMSGTLEAIFRRDLPRIKYRPTNKETIYYTENGKLPKIDKALLFSDNATNLKQNYPDNCVVGKNHHHNNVDVHTTNLNLVLSTSALREGISINNDNFKACMVLDSQCNHWSTKDKIQATQRVRAKDAIKIISAPPKPQYTKNIDVDKWVEWTKKQTDTQQINAVMGENYSKFIKLTHQLNNYEEADDYGVVCYLASLTRNNYDPDFYEFKPYEWKEGEEALEIDLTRNKEAKDQDQIVTYTEDDNVWEVPQKNMNLFLSWLIQLKSGFISRLLKFQGRYKNLGEMYKNSHIAKELKRSYNKLNKKSGKTYTIKMFYKLIRSLVQIEMLDKNGNTIKRVGSKTNYKEISIKIVGKKFKTINEIANSLAVPHNTPQTPTTPTKQRNLSFLITKLTKPLNPFQNDKKTILKNRDEKIEYRLLL